MRFETPWTLPRKDSAVIELKGKPVADALMSALSVRVQALADRGVTPQLAIVEVGDDSANRWYRQAAIRRLEAAHCEVAVISLSDKATQPELNETLDRLSADDQIHGILLLRPLPAHLNEQEAADHTSALKDVDGMSDASLAGVFLGNPGVFAPCTADAVIRLLNHYGFEYRGSRASVLGRSAVVGRPVASLLLVRDATVTQAHSKTPSLKDACSQADLVVSAMGVLGALDQEVLPSGCWLVDVSCNSREDGSMAGDAVWDRLGDIAAATPVPGGVGAVTTAVLAEHLVSAAERQNAHF